tara:strand:- start:523 stop:954 length:432 start_codon:yes stop_codon:yes gene_type:complete
LISIEDIKTMLISESKLRLLALFGFLYLISLGLSNKDINSIDLILDNFYAMIIVFVSLYLLSIISYKIIGITSLGLGDIKISTVSSLWLGIDGSFTSLCISFLISSLYSLYGKLSGKFKKFHQYPFAPFLSIGIVSTLILNKI